MKIRTVNMIEVADWDVLVQKTYGRPYEFQQQNGCQDRGIHTFSVPNLDDCYDDEMADSIPEVVNHDEMGVKFAIWLARDPKQPLPGREDEFGINLWWSRNFYPDFQAVANDLHAKGLLEAGEYMINIDW